MEGWKGQGMTGCDLSHTGICRLVLREGRSSAVREVSEMKDEETTHSQVVELGLLTRRVCPGWVTQVSRTARLNPGTKRVTADSETQPPSAAKRNRR